MEYLLLLKEAWSAGLFVMKAAATSALTTHRSSLKETYYGGPWVINCALPFALTEDLPSLKEASLDCLWVINTASTISYSREQKQSHLTRALTVRVPHRNSLSWNFPQQLFSKESCAVALQWAGLGTPAMQVKLFTIKARPVNLA